MAPKQEEAPAAMQAAQAPQLKPRVQSFLAKAGKEVDLANVRPERAKALEAAKSSGNLRKVQAAVMQIAREDAPAVAVRWQLEAAQKRGYKLTEEQKDRVMFHTKIIVDSPEKGLGAYKDAMAELRGMMKRQDAARAALAKKKEEKPAEKQEQQISNVQYARIMLSSYASNKGMSKTYDEMSKREAELKSQYFPKGFNPGSESKDFEKLNAIKEKDPQYQAILQKFYRQDKLMSAGVSAADVNNNAFYQGGRNERDGWPPIIAVKAAVMAPFVLDAAQSKDQQVVALVNRNFGSFENLKRIVERDLQATLKNPNINGDTSKMRGYFNSEESFAAWQEAYRAHFGKG